jgi:tetratricopeptide (TPR) repeat protein
MTFFIRIFIAALAFSFSIPLYAETRAYAQAVSFFYQKNYNQALARLSQTNTSQDPEKPALMSSIYILQKKPSLAKQALAQYYPSDDTIKDYVRFLQFKIGLLEKKNWTIKDWEAVHWENTFLTRFSLLEVARSQFNAGKIDEADVLVKQVLLYPTDTVIRPQALKLLTEIEMENRNGLSAIKLYSEMLQLAPQLDESKTLWKKIQQVFGIRGSVIQSFAAPTQLIPYLQQLLQQQQFEELEKRSLEAIARFPKSKQTPEFNYYVGMSYYGQKRYKLAIKYFDIASALNRDLSKRNFFHFPIAESYVGVNDNRALRLLGYLSESSQNNPYQTQSLFWLCRYYKQMGEDQNYARNKKKLEAIAGTHSLENQALNWMEDWARLKTNLTVQAPVNRTIQHLENLIKNTAVSTKILRFYWRKAGDTQEGLMQFPISYYSASLLKSVYDPELLSPKAIELQLKNDTLFKMGLGQLALMETEFFETSAKNTEEKSDYIYAKLHLKLRQSSFAESLKAIRSFLPDSATVYGHFPAFLVKFFYPRAYWTTIQTYAKLYQVDPYLVLAIMREESQFNPNAISRMDARGLMQILPETAKDISFRQGQRWKGLNTLFDPETNIKLGTYYISWLQQNIKGPPFYIMAAYNAGPEKAAYWIQQNPTHDMEKFVSSLPYTETQAYIQRVSETYMIYKMLYE